MSKLSAEQAVIHVTNEWLARRPAHSPTDTIQAGGEGNGLLSARYATHYKGSRIWTDGNTIYSYNTPLLTIILAGRAISPEPYYTANEYSNTTARQIRIINRILAQNNIGVAQ